MRVQQQQPNWSRPATGGNEGSVGRHHKETDSATERARNKARNEGQTVILDGSLDMTFS